MLLPLKDNIPTDRFPVITVLLIVLNLAVFGWQLSLPGDEASSQALAQAGVSERDQASIEYGAIPFRITHPGSECAVRGQGPQAELRCGDRVGSDGQGGGDGILDLAPWWLTLISSMFMHGGLLHLGGNMLFLWIFGNNVEDSMGRGRFVAFYLLAGLAAVYAQAAIDTSSTVPTIGASGAVAGVLGAYALLHPRARVLTFVLVIFFFTFIEIPALLMLGVWFALQFLPAVSQTVAADGSAGGVAYLAHVGGFIFGLVMIKLFARGPTRSAALPDPRA